MKLAKINRRAAVWGSRLALIGCALMLGMGMAAAGQRQNPPAPGEQKHPAPETSPLKPHSLAPAGQKPAAPAASPADHPQEAAALSNEQIADLHMARKEFADAVDFYLRALRDVGNERAKIWNKIGIAYQQQLDYKHARRAYKRAIDLDKTFAQPWNNLGTSYFLVHKAKKSLKYYRHAIKLEPDVASFHLNLGTAYYQMKKVSESLAEYRTALTLNPDILVENARNAAVVQTRTADAKFFFYLAKIFASLNRPHEALRYLRRAMEEGFQDQQIILNDPDMQKLSKMPAFIELMKHPPVAIK